MYLAKSIMDGLKILGFEKKTIKKVSKEKDLEEIFLSTLFLNYLIVLVLFFVGITSNGFQINGRELNPPVLYGLLLIYPFIYNLLVYVVYGLFGLMAELLNKKNKIEPLLSVGYHTAIVYSGIIYIIGLLLTINPSLSLFLLTCFGIYFIIAMFYALSTVYSFSTDQTLIVLMTPFLIIGVILLLFISFIPETVLKSIIAFFLS